MKKRYEVYKDGVLIESYERQLSREEQEMIWLSKLASTDAKIPRAIEDIIDVLDVSTKARLPKETWDAYQHKKSIREQRP